jgi:AraC family transcriptional regulator
MIEKINFPLRPVGFQSESIRRMNMAEINVRIVRLAPLRVASINGYGPNPETLAWDQMTAWMKSKGLDQDVSSRRFFGFNNPNPSAGSPNYGYDVWVTVGEDVKTDSTVKVLDFQGGLYAVTHVMGVENIFPTWQELVAWCEHSSYHRANHQWLEEHLGFDADLVHRGGLDLYLPVSE